MESQIEAKFWTSIDNKRVRCGLCNHFCLISDGKTGICGVRINRGGKLFTLVYGNIIAEHTDPIEKKPFFHFLPGSLAYSIATAGCNFSCIFCQNYSISRVDEKREILLFGKESSPDEIVNIALKNHCLSISYTYTEPTIFFEFAFDTAKKAKEKGLRNNFVTNGYMSKEALEAIAPYLDAANIHLKGDDAFYRKLCGAKREPVIENIRLMRDLGVWVEVTTLIVPEYNDSEQQIRETAKIIKDIDIAIPWHISRFYPHYKMSSHYPTPQKTIQMAREIGYQQGLRYVYTGNIPGDEGEHTYCYSCKKLLIHRYGFSILENKIRDGKCPFCGTVIDGVF
ncbi:MAG: AmmeMemoRadiSam system radical SAM enzyme [Candidatus Omnitrophica bacterium]|nr:AmmeMemoRadiSam system radical SAM enzyme [Candidatus Omnitrophota bacterium]